MRGSVTYPTLGRTGKGSWDEGWSQLLLFTKCIVDITVFFLACVSMQDSALGHFEDALRQAGSTVTQVFRPYL